jgi:hypothetical protein
MENHSDYKLPLKNDFKASEPDCSGTQEHYIDLSEKGSGDGTTGNNFSKIRVFFYILLLWILVLYNIAKLLFIFPTQSNSQHYHFFLFVSILAGVQLLILGIVIYSIATKDIKRQQVMNSMILGIGIFNLLALMLFLLILSFITKFAETIIPFGTNEASDSRYKNLVNSLIPYPVIAVFGEIIIPISTYFVGRKIGFKEDLNNRTQIKPIPTLTS